MIRVSFRKIDLKMLVIFTLVVGLLMIGFMFLFEPFRNIPILNGLFQGQLAYETPMTMIDHYLPLVLTLTSVTMVMYLLYMIYKYWK